MSPAVLLRAAAACLVVGTALMIGLDSGYARIAGVILLVAFIALAALAIATPDYLGGSPDDER